MKIIKLGQIVFGFIFTAILAISPAWSTPEETPHPGFAWQNGAEIYAKICAYCHEAQVGPPIRNRELPPAYIRAIVRNGKRAMPAFRSSEIDDESLVKLVDFISKKETEH
ncbi:cytochrome c [Nitrosomonas communis]|uniref:c-type cytochrome n=1 Tax=Nitrosomonas communis TaxID=44574 RepID=UPI0026ED9D4D|nr:cytochrome c [Nitrosomonas communis]MCO6426457.1 cytochrome c [Nitrosomonas communis]